MVNEARWVVALKDRLRFGFFYLFISTAVPLRTLFWAGMCNASELMMLLNSFLFFFFFVFLGAISRLTMKSSVAVIACQLKTELPLPSLRLREDKIK